VNKHINERLFLGKAHDLTKLRGVTIKVKQNNVKLTENLENDVINRRGFVEIRDRHLSQTIQRCVY